MLNKAAYFFEKVLSILEPWRVQLATEERKQVIYENLSNISGLLGGCYNSLGEKARDCCDMAISYAKQAVIEEKRRVLLFNGWTLEG